MSDLPEHVARNRAFWNEAAAEWVQPGRGDWAAKEPRWGIFRVPEAELGLLPKDLEGKEAIELGCGTGYVSSWLARRGATMLCGPDDENEPATDRMIRPYFGMRRYEWPDGSVEFHLPHGEMIALLRKSGFELEELIEEVGRARKRG
ncbi:MAG TPA: hypothetical protein VFN18_05695 [Solirubrobacterales bacterium]|nr:hypothetical protein [Solirubrobacterales bacterium]